MRRFECTEEGASKFWEIHVEGVTLTILFGKIGTKGQTSTKTLATAAEAQAQAAKLVAEKSKKGYVEVTAAAPTKPSPAPASKPSAKAAAVRSKAEPALPEANPAVDAMLAAIKKKHTSITDGLGAPATEDALAALAALHAPPGLLALYARHDGGEQGVFREFRLLSVAEIHGHRASMNAAALAAPTRFANRWHATWLPFLGDGDGQYLVVAPTADPIAGVAGQVLAYDHERGPERFVQSFDEWVALVTALAKKGLLDGDDELDDDQQAQYDELVAKASARGIAKLTDAERRKRLAGLPDADEDAVARRDGLRRLTREAPADAALWSELCNLEETVGDWRGVADAARRHLALLPAKDRELYLPRQVTALHFLGEDAAALALLKHAAEARSPERLVDVGAVSTAFAATATRAIAELAPRSIEVWHQLALVGSGDERGIAADRVVARSLESGLSNEARWGALASEATLCRVADLPLAERVAGYAAMVDAHLAAEKIIRLQAITLARLAARAGAWDVVRRAIEPLRDAPGRPLDADHVAFAVRAAFELGDDAAALAEFVQTVGEAADADATTVLSMFPWRVLDDLPLGGHAFADVAHPLDEVPCVRTERHRAQERAMFGALVEAQPDDPLWRYGAAATIDDAAARAKAWTALAKHASLGGAAATLEPTAGPALWVRLRVLHHQGKTADALALQTTAIEAAEGAWEAVQFHPFRMSATDPELDDATRTWFEGVFTAIAGRFDDDVFAWRLLARYTADPTRKRAALARLDELVPEPELDVDTSIDDFRDRVEVLFEQGRDDEAFALAERSIASRGDRDALAQRIVLALPWRNASAPVRPQAEREALQQRWFELALRALPDHPGLWFERAKRASAPAVRRERLDHALLAWDGARGRDRSERAEARSMRVWTAG